MSAVKEESKVGAPIAYACAMTLVDAAAAVLRPQAVLLTFFGDYVADDRPFVGGSSVITLLERIGVAEHAARATLNRMVRRGLLERRLSGRRGFYGLTDDGRATTLEGRERASEQDVVARDWDGRWTVVAFSMPEEWQRERHDLRARLQWAGFGPAQAGLWVAPRTVDVADLVRGLRGGEHVRAFDAVPIAPGDAGRLIGDAYDLEALAARYVAFDRRWRARAAQVLTDPDPLVQRCVLSADWLQVVRGDPRLPLDHLPAPWPAVDAAELFRELFRALEPAARRQFRRTVEFLG